MLLLLGQLLLRITLGQAQIVHPKNSALALLECSGRRIRRGRKKRPHKIGHWPHIQPLHRWKRDRFGPAERFFDRFSLFTIQFDQWLLWPPLHSRFLDQLARRGRAPQARRGQLEQIVDPIDLFARQRLDLSQRIVDPKLVPHPALQQFRSNRKGTFRR